MDAFKKSRMHHRIARASPLPPHRSRVRLASRTHRRRCFHRPSVLPRVLLRRRRHRRRLTRRRLPSVFFPPTALPSRARVLVYEIPENHLCVRDTCTYSKRHMIEECKKAHARAHSNSTEMGLSRAQYASRVLDAVGRTRRAREGNNFRVDSATRAREFSRLDAREIDDRWT